MVGFSVEWDAQTYKKAETELVGTTCRKFAESAQGSLTMADFSLRFLKLKINISQITKSQSNIALSLLYPNLCPQKAITVLRKRISSVDLTASREAGFAKVWTERCRIGKEKYIRNIDDRSSGCGIVVKKERETRDQSPPPATRPNTN